MTYQTGSATDLVDLLSKLSTFATTTHGGWSQGYLNVANGWLELSKGNLSVSFKWNPSTKGSLSVHHATAFVSTGTAPGKHTGDSNIGYNTTDTGHSDANLISERCVNAIGDGPFVSYHFFADDTTNDYIHVVVEAEPTIFRHFGFGTLDKVGDNWTGGEYVYGHNKVQTTNSSATTFSSTANAFLIDDCGVNDLGATVRATGLPNQAAGSKFVLMYSASSAASSSDQDGDPHSSGMGTARGGMMGYAFNAMAAGTGSLHVPLIPIHAFYKDYTNKHVYLMGTQPDVFLCNVENLTAGTEFTIGSDTYIAFPAAQKTDQVTLNRTYFGGYAYKKVS